MRRISVFGDRQAAIQEVSVALWTYRDYLFQPPIILISPLTQPVFQAAADLNPETLGDTAAYEVRLLNRLSTLNDEKQSLDAELQSAERQLRKMDQKTSTNQSDLLQRRRLRLKKIDLTVCY